MSVTVELSELDAFLWDAFRHGGEWVNASEYRKLMAQNAKLRELVKDMLPFAEVGMDDSCVTRRCCLYEQCDTTVGDKCLIEAHMLDRMRELGVD